MEEKLSTTRATIFVIWVVSLIGIFFVSVGTSLRVMSSHATNVAWVFVGLLIITALKLDLKIFHLLIQLVQLFKDAHEKEQARYEQQEQLRYLEEKVPGWRREGLKLKPPK